MYVHRAVIAGVGVAPHHVHQIFPAVDPPRVLHQQLDEVVLLGRQLHRFPVPDRHPLFRVQRQLPYGDPAAAPALGSPGGPPQHGPDAGFQLQKVEGLGDVVVRAALKADDLVRILAAGREHDNRHVGELPDAHTRLQTIDFRHHQVQYHQVELSLPRQLHSRCAVVGAFHLVALVFQIEFQALDHQFFIVYY